jgi:hypothetical protein
MKNRIFQYFVSICVFVLSISNVFGTELGQGWTEDARDRFYYLSQGSQMMPYTWFLSLERNDSQDLFVSDGLTRFGYIPGKVTEKNKDKLPVGFALDKDKKGYWVGLTCAACHVAEFSYKGKTIRVDGAPSQADIFKFISAIDETIISTLSDDKKFIRFANRVNSRTKKKTDLNKIKSDLARFSRDWSTFVSQSTSKTVWGPGRNDAFNMIFNRIGAIDLNLPENSRFPEAPVSYPHLWGASYHNKVQWNGIVKNTGPFDSLGRNTGEVLGVFGAADLQRITYRPYYKTSIRKINLIELEKKIRKLYSPIWPEDIFGRIDRDAASKGQALFKTNCERCHKELTRESQHMNIEINMWPIHDVGTDPTMAYLACTRTMKTGRLQGSELPFSEPLPAEMKSAEFLKHLVVGAILEPSVFNEFKNLFKESRNLNILSKSTGENDLSGLANEYLKTQSIDTDCGKDSSIMAYKARPLEGIWATPPYLHNGSIKNLYELLLPATKRTKTFIIGGIEFDEKNVGLADGNPNGGFIYDTDIPGNSNAGHDTYGNEIFTEEQRRQLVEYMKTL